MAYKHYFAQGAVHYSLFIVSGLLIPCVWLGWKVSAKQWGSKMLLGIVDLMVVACSNFAHKLLMNYVNQFLKSQ
ncbi:MAG: hypothetical protein QM652_07905 [Legionella sp.]|uniref:hypothetical protein n=1 Tax=Legionella sp. TaxID=459 RepID=UPI0039E52206